eukprot:g7097.t1
MDEIARKSKQKHGFQGYQGCTGVSTSSSTHVEPVSTSLEESGGAKDDALTPRLAPSHSLPASHILPEPSTRGLCRASSEPAGKFQSFQKLLELSDLRARDDNIVTGFIEPDAFERERIQHEFENDLVQGARHNIPTSFRLGDMAPVIRRGMITVVQDDFSKCFESAAPDNWNWNIYLFIFWSIGVLIRYLILFPIRCIILFMGFLGFFLGMGVLFLVYKDKSRRKLQERKLASYLAYMFVFSWFGVVKYHGVAQARKPNRIWVANHTSMIDIMVLLTVNSYALVGQRHPGWIGGMQHALDGLGCLWFDRKETRDREQTAQKIKDHIHKEGGNRLLVFPEGTCVNNKYCVQFKRGVFGMDAEICPIAIKYNMIFADAFWNSRVESFSAHLMRLMCSWAVVCDVYFLPPMKIGEGETDIDFSKRVKAAIAKKAGLIDRQWDGYLKHFKPSGRYVQVRQQLYAESLMKGASVAEADEKISENPPGLPDDHHHDHHSEEKNKPDSESLPRAKFENQVLQVVQLNSEGVPLRDLVQSLSEADQPASKDANTLLVNGGPAQHAPRRRTKRDRSAKGDAN